jgi:hypothetical protein
MKYVCTYKFVHACMHVRVCKLSACMHSCTHTRPNSRICKHVFIHVCAYIRVTIHTYIQAPKLSSSHIKTECAPLQIILYARKVFFRKGQNAHVIKIRMAVCHCIYMSVCMLECAKGGARVTLYFHSCGAAHHHPVRHRPLAAARHQAHPTAAPHQGDWHAFRAFGIHVYCIGSMAFLLRGWLIPFDAAHHHQAHHPHHHHRRHHPPAAQAAAHREYLLPRFSRIDRTTICHQT